VSFSSCVRWSQDLYMGVMMMDYSQPKNRWNIFKFMLIIGLFFGFTLLLFSNTVSATDTSQNIVTITFMQDMTISPGATVSVPVGTKVIWANTDPFKPHSIMSTDVETMKYFGGAGTVEIPYGKTYAVIFDKVGSYSYTTGPFQPTMQGTIVVVDGTSEPTISPTTITTVPTTIPTTQPTAAITLPPQTTKTIIYMRNNLFVPQELTVLPGTGVSWVNEDSIIHSVKITGIHAGMFNSGDIIPGASSGNTFANEGVFEFACPDHPNMKGKIVVKVGAPTTQTTGLTTAPTPSPTSVQTTGPTSSPTAVTTTLPTTAITTGPTTQTTIKTPTPTPTPNYDAKIAALESQLAVQNQKIEEQGNILDKITSFLRNIFGWNIVTPTPIPVTSPTRTSTPTPTTIQSRTPTPTQTPTPQIIYITITPTLTPTPQYVTGTITPTPVTTTPTTSIVTKTSVTLTANPQRYSPMMSSTPGIGIWVDANGFDAVRSQFAWNATFGNFYSWGPADSTVKEVGNPTTNHGEILYWSFTQKPASTRDPVVITVTATDSATGRMLGSANVVLQWDGYNAVMVK